MRASQRNLIITFILVFLIGLIIFLSHISQSELNSFIYQQF